VIEKRGLCLFGWREVPVNRQILGTKALMTLPDIEQVLVGRPWGMADDDYERRLFLARNEIEKRAAADKIEGFYIPSFSHRLIVYKGLLVSSSLEKFFPTSPIPTTRPRSASITSVTARTPSRPGRSPIPSG